MYLSFIDAFQHNYNNNVDNNNNNNIKNNNNNINSSTVVNIDSICNIFQNYFSSLTTTSPNSILLASIDASRSHFAKHGVNLMKQAVINTDEFRYSIRNNGNDDNIYL